ncbi:MAG: hypothetical protein ACRYFS_24450 [Janthinobacterium lividum]
MTHFRISQPPACPQVWAGSEHDRLLKTARSVSAKGQIETQRLTQPLKGERFLLQIHAARNTQTGETWRTATFTSADIPGHIRTVLITPTGETWLFFPADEKTRTRCIFSNNKYRSKIWQISQQEGTAK